MVHWRRPTALGSQQEGAQQLRAESADGCPVSAYDEGRGPVTVIISGGGLEAGGYALAALPLGNPASTRAARQAVTDGRRRIDCFNKPCPPAIFVAWRAPATVVQRDGRATILNYSVPTFVPA